VALELIDTAIEVDKDEMTPPEFNVLKGNILHLEGDLDGAASAFESAAEVASLADTPLHELIALTGLVRLRRQRGQVPDGSDDLARVYEKFTEGFEELPLLEAKAVLSDSSA
jgi:hypothetical protein